MKLLLCIDHFGPGGAQRQLVALAKGLRALGHELEFFIYHPHIDHFGDQVRSLGIKVHSHEKASKVGLGAALALASTMRTGNYDGALAFLATPALYGELARLANPRLPLVVSERFMYTTMSPKVRVLQGFHRWASWITVNSRHQRERMEQHFPWMRRKISTIYNGVDLEVFSPTTASANRGPSEHVSLLVVASTASKKNAMGLAKALAAIRSRGARIPHISWAGAPTTAEDERSKRQVEEYLDDQGLASHWTWLGKRSDVPELMRTHDALVHPAFYEGLPNAICEALATGLPVLASNVGDHGELVGSDRGFLFDPSDPEDIATAIERFAATDSSQRSQMGLRARDYAVANLSLERYAKDYEQLFEGLIGARTRIAAVGAS